MTTPSITLAEAQETLAAYRAAELKVLEGQAYSIGGRSMTRANLRDIREGIQFWSAEVARLAGSSNGGVVLQVGVPTHE